jgi:nucleotide-binding universal stress UspA family protein
MVSPDDPTTILLATDLSASAGPATETAFRLAKGLGAHLLVMSAIDLGSIRLPNGRYRHRIDQERELRESAARSIVERGHAIGVSVGLLVWEGDPGESIVEVARAERPEMVIVGSRTKGVMGRFGIGSVSDHVVHHAPCPVLVVRFDAEVPAGPGTPDGDPAPTR